MTTVAARILAAAALTVLLAGCAGSGQDRANSTGSSTPATATPSGTHAVDPSAQPSATAETPITQPSPGSTDAPVGDAPPGESPGEWPADLPQPAGCENIMSEKSATLTVVTCTMAGDVNTVLATVVSTLTDAGASVGANGVSHGIGAAEAATADGAAIEAGVVDDPDHAGRCLVTFSMYR